MANFNKKGSGNFIMEQDHNMNYASKIWIFGENKKSL